jgi:hypothetical protein
MAREPDKSARETGKVKNEAPAGSKNGGTEETADARSSASGALELLKAQRQDLQATLAKRSDVNADPSTIAKEFAAAWLPHTAVEQDILVPALKDAGIEEEKITSIAIQKDIINLLLADLLQRDDPEFARAKLEALAKQFDALIEGGDGGLFAIVSSTEKAIPGLNAQMKARYERTKRRFANMDESIGEAMAMLAPRRLSVTPGSRQNRREYEMNRYSNVRDRDEQGRFVSDDEREYGRGSRSSGRDRDEQGRFMGEGGSRSRSRYEDDDNQRYSRGGPERDENGRFMSEGGSHSRGRYDDEDERYGRRSTGRERDDEGHFTRRGGSYEGRGRGGWFGDSEGHSEASRRGWDNPRHGESGWYGDSEGHSGASRRGWDNPRHGESGWYGDSEGHSEASRRGWDNPRHGESGWYGDPEGHSEASRRGWDERGRSPRYEERSRRYDEMTSRSRSRYDDDRDYERGNGGRGHGGWSGDPEGHSEASRRGWQNRR